MLRGDDKEQEHYQEGRGGVSEVAAGGGVTYSVGGVTNSVGTHVRHAT